MGTWDKVTDERIATLDKRVQPFATRFINRVYTELGITLRVTQGRRSIVEQNGFYAQGRTKPGKIITNAKGGYSYHNFGLALDVVVIKNGQADWTVLNKDIVRIAKEEGFEWGGDWKSFKDYPHFQMTFGQSLEQLRRQAGIK